MNGTNVANEMSVVSEVNISEIALKLAEQLSLREGLVQNFKTKRTYVRFVQLKL